MSKHLLTALKLLFAAGLIVWVGFSIQWTDVYVSLDPATNAELTRTPGEILDRWDADTVRFRPEDATTELVLTPGDEVRLEPGFLTYLRYLKLPWFLLGALCYVLSVTFAGTRWWWLLQVNNLPVSFWAAQRFSWIGIFFNNVVPGQTGGDLVKAIYAMKRSHGARIPAIMSVVVDRVMGLASLALLAAISVLFYLDRDGFATLALALWAILFAVILLGVVAFSRRVRGFIRLTALLERLPLRLSMLLKRVDQAVYFYRGHKAGMVLWLFAGILNHVSSVLSYAFVGIALGVGIPLVDYFVLIPIIIIVSAVPIAPNGWGVGEYMFRKLFGEFGAPVLTGVATERAVQIMGTRGVALSVLYRIHLTVLSFIGGLLFFFDKDKVTKKDMEASSGASEEAALDAEVEAAMEHDDEPEVAAESTESERPLG